MYKIASDKRQASLHRGSLKDWLGDGAEHLTRKEQYDNLKRVVNNLNQRILALPHGPERKALGAQKLKIQLKLKTIKDEVKAENISNQHLGDYFMRAAFDRIQHGLFMAIKAAAEKMMKDDSVHVEELRKLPDKQ
jgi:hypothetical protein